MAFEGIADFAWTVAKWSALLAFFCMDWTHSFPPGSWAATFDNVFSISVGVWAVTAFINAVIKVSSK